jgi:hypothetical protein
VQQYTSFSCIMVFTSRNWFAMQGPVAIILISWKYLKVDMIFQSLWSYHDSLDRGLLLTRKLLNQGCLVDKLKSSRRTFYRWHFDFCFIVSLFVFFSMHGFWLPLNDVQISYIMTYIHPLYKSILQINLTLKNLIDEMKIIFIYKYKNTQ